MGKTSRYHRKHDGILEAALEQFVRFGYEKTTLAVIAKHAKIGKASIYHYYQSKEEIFRAVLDRELNELGHAVQRSVNSVSSAVEKIHAYIRTRIQFIQNKVREHNVGADVIVELLPIVRKMYLPYFETEMRTFQTILETGIRNGELRPIPTEATAKVLTACTYGMFHLFHTENEAGEIIELFERYMELLSDAFTPAEAP